MHSDVETTYCEMKRICNALILTTFLFVFSTIEGFGQEMIFSGIVIDEQNGNPLSDVRIFINDKELKGLTNKQGEFRISFSAIKGSDRVRFWKTGYVFQTFQISKIKEINELKIKLSKGGTGITVSNEREIMEVYLDDITLPKEEWGDINSKEIINVEMRSADPNNDIRTAKHIILYIYTK